MITKEDLLKEISQKELLELTDLNAKGSLDEEVLSDAISDAISFISSFIKIPDNPTPLLKNIACDLTIWELRKRNKITIDDKDKLKTIENYLIKMATKKIPTSIDNQDDIKITNSSFAFKKRGKRVDTKGFLWQKKRKKR